MSQETPKDTNSYKDTLNLPRTDFPIRAQNDVFDPIVLQRWENEDVYNKTFAVHEGKEKFILHDGPPYANGDIHLGHAYNKILKDIICKYERMNGKHVPCIPGWDCHGLPIELKVSAEHPEAKGDALKVACRAYAEKWIEVQKASFKKLGVLMDFDHPYATMDYSYEAAIVRAFGDFVKKGYIQKKLKTVPWCASCKTVLATAEIEYEERKDPSIFVKFPLSQFTIQKLWPDLESKEVSLLVWTTTPWTLPLNRAVVLHPTAAYQVVDFNGSYVILAKDLIEKVGATIGISGVVIADLTAADLQNSLAHHPFIADLQVPILTDHFVSVTDGTACVHNAPGCGPEDYEVGLKNGLEIYSPLSADGKYTQEIVPSELVGMPIVDGQIWVIKKLAELDRMLFKSNIKHSFPHCWRCHNGLMFRATSQWFCNLAQHNLQERAVKAIDGISMWPAKSKNRSEATVEGRLEWCLSRQRSWGVPIPALICVDSDFVYTNPEFIEKVAQAIEKHGIEYWDTVSIEELMPEGLACPQTGSKNFIKERDILDVWFESGVSHYAVLFNNSTQAFPADMYLEGKDQHRAWFQSSLLTSLVLEDKAPMKSIMTHGFTVDEKGRKMSKSLGNVVLPQELVRRMGTDGLLLWVITNDISSDPVVSEKLLTNVSEVYRKIRNTCRFLLSNLYDFDASKDLVSLEDLLEIDKYALYQLAIIDSRIKSAYQHRDITALFHELADYFVKELSAFYLDIIKDRLYVERADGKKRRAAQTVCYYLLDVLTKLMAPVLSFTTELISDNYQKGKTDSIHLQTFASTEFMKAIYKDSVYRSLHMPANISVLMENSSYKSTSELFDVGGWGTLRALRKIVLGALEGKRAEGLIKHSLDAKVSLYIDSSYAEIDVISSFEKALQVSGSNLAEFYAEFFIVSQMSLEKAEQSIEVASGIYVKIEKAPGEKCSRCWQWHSYISDELCSRCFAIVK